MILIWILFLLSKGLMWVYSFFVFPIAFLNRKAVRDCYYNGPAYQKILAFPMWIVLDDQDDYGEDWWLYTNNYKKNFKTAWIWGWARNNSWNWNNGVIRLSAPHNNYGDVPDNWWNINHESETVLWEWKTDDKDARHFRRFKWEYWDKEKEEWVGDWLTNQGDRLSEDKSWIGTCLCTYNAYKGPFRKRWRFSHNGFIGKAFMITVKAGWNNHGEVMMTLKLKRFKEFYTEHWKTK